MPSWTIGEVAERAGLAPSAIRFYEASGLLPKPPRVSGRRVYSEDVLPRLALIHLAQDAGFRLAEIRRLLTGFGRRTPPSRRWRQLASQKLHELDAQRHQLVAMERVLRHLLRCRCPSLDDCARAMRQVR